MLNRMRGCRNRIIGRIRSGDDQVYLRDIVRQFGKSVLHGLKAHGIDILPLFRFRAGMNSRPLLNPLTCQPAQFKKMLVIYPFFRHIKPCRINKHSLVSLIYLIFIPLNIKFITLSLRLIRWLILSPMIPRI